MLESVRTAAERIRKNVRRTPIETSRSLDALTGARLFFKCENLQRGGSFKIRGAMNAVLSLADAELGPGVATHSSGNHAQALAIAAADRGIPACVVMPKDAPRSKREATLARGARIVDCDSTLQAREDALEAVVRETGAVFVPPYDDDRVIAGQGTVLLEMREEIGDLDAAVVPIGGGGLAAGSCKASETVAVYAAEPELADDAHRSILIGERLGPRPPLTVADGLRTALSNRTFEIVRSGLEDVLLVSEEEILAAMRLLWDRLKLVVEPSGAVAFASVLRYRRLFAGKKVGIILSGGNLDLECETLGRLFR